MKIQRIAKHNMILRVTYAAMQEGIFDHETYLIVIDYNKSIKCLRNAREIYDYIYTSRKTDIAAIKINDGKEQFLIKDIQYDLLHKLVYRKIMKKKGSSLEENHWLNFQIEMLDSLKQEVLSIVASIKLKNALRGEIRTYHNIWTWATNETKESWLQKHRHDLDSFFIQVASFPGHPTHPSGKMRLILDPVTPQKRHSLTSKDVQKYFPEFAPDVQLSLYAVQADRLTVSISTHLPKDYRKYMSKSFPEVYEKWEQALVKQVGARASTNYLPIPVHPLQIPEIAYRFAKELQSHIIQPLPEVSICQRPTMSTRTLTPVNTLAPQIKTTINMQLTSVVRTIAPARSYNSPIYSDLIRDILQKDVVLAQVLRPVMEEVAIYYGVNSDSTSQDYKDGYHLGALFKQNPAWLVESNEIRIPLAALLKETPFSQKPAIIDIMQASGIESSKEAENYFRRYVDKVISADIGILSRYGISLEGHQQNDDIVFDTHSGQPKAIIYRDINGGIELCNPLIEMNGYFLVSKIHHVRKGIYEDIQIPLEQTTHTTFYSHLFPLVSIISKIYDISQVKLYRHIRESIENVLEYALEIHLPTILEHIPLPKQEKTIASYKLHIQELRNHLLTHDMKVKCLLTMRLEATQSLQFCDAANPLCLPLKR
jgi:siderophore synthetase component